MAKHAYLSASASERWLKCPPSAKLCAQEEDKGSPYAQQGTDAHELCQYLVEQALDFSKWVGHGFGTGDCVIVADDLLHIIDFKFGLGVLVEAKDNSQFKCYALGALDTFGDLYDIRRIKLSIYQPRRDNVDT